MRNLELEKTISGLLLEDSCFSNLTYLENFSDKTVHLELNIKDDLILAGLPYFQEVFRQLCGENHFEIPFYKKETQKLKKGEKLSFTLPANVAISGERLALNLLQRASSIATATNELVALLKDMPIVLLDTRKTTPGLRGLEKYAVRIGGGYNHRFFQDDIWMIKDNHKKIYGSLKGAYDFFKSLGSFYKPIVCEIHDLKELDGAKELGIRHFLLDNFSVAQVLEAIKVKPQGSTYEVSGGINKDNIKSYALSGVDAISSSAITINAKAVDISLKIK